MRTSPTFIFRRPHDLHYFIDHFERRIEHLLYAVGDPRDLVHHVIGYGPLQLPGEMPLVGKIIFVGLLNWNRT